MDRKEALRQQRAKELRDLFSQPKVWMFIILGLIVLYLALGPIPVKVDYPEDRVSSFRPGADFTRISILNTILCVLAIVYGYPRMFINKIFHCGA